LKLDGRTLEDAFSKGETIAITIEGNATPIAAEDVTITRSYGRDWAGASEGKTVVMLDTRLTPTLKNEGMARDIIRNVQNLRKNAALDIADRITLSITTTSEAVRAALDEFTDYIAAETLATRIGFAALETPLAHDDVKLDGEGVTLALAKA
jgi:isoleucyl-tRNA synthetase